MAMSRWVIPCLENERDPMEDVDRNIWRAGMAFAVFGVRKGR